MLSEARESGELGRITFVRVHCFGGDWVCGPQGQQIATDEPAPAAEVAWPEWLPPADRDSYYLYNNIYCHNLNLLRYLFGEPDGLHSVWLRGRSGLALLDYGTFPVSLESGSLDAYRWDEHLLIVFERGSLEIATSPPLLRNVPARVRLYRGGDAKQIVEPLAPHGWAFQREAQHFVDCVARRREPASPARDAVADMALVEAIFRRSLEQTAACQQG
jgi:predicted dehydrogenase